LTTVLTPSGLSHYDRSFHSENLVYEFSILYVDTGFPTVKRLVEAAVTIVCAEN